MSNSKLVEYVHLSPNCTKPRQNKIKKITIHHMACNGTLEGIGNAFAKPERECSSNYAIDSDGNVAMYCEEVNRSWCSSNAENDHQAITIEVANDGGAETDWHVSDKALAKLIDLCVDICERNDIEKLNYTGDKNGNLTKHCYFANTECPAKYLGDKFPYIADEVNNRLHPKEDNTPKNYTEYVVQPNDSWWGIAEKTLGDGNRYMELVHFNGYDAPPTIHPNDIIKIPCDNKVKQPNPQKSKEDLTVVAKRVIRGDYGNGNERKEKLETEGYNYKEVQSLVNKMC